MQTYIKNYIQNVLSKWGYQIVRTKTDCHDAALESSLPADIQESTGNEPNAEECLTQYRSAPEKLNISQVSFVLNGVGYWEDKISLMKLFTLDQASGCYFLTTDGGSSTGKQFWNIIRKYYTVNDDFFSKLNSLAPVDQANSLKPGFEKIHYGCGDNIFKDWLNVDFNERPIENYLRVPLTDKHPFKDKTFRYGYSEDVVEHFTQADSLIFLSEAYRTLQEGGVLRLSFPSLEGVLAKHYKTEEPYFHFVGKLEAYSYWDHIHFYSRDELRTVAKHIGFRKIDFVEYGKSTHQALSGLDTRAHQIGLNMYVELTK